jgi:5-methylthioadenosine/S-adenosylhomocysteine deaminase
MNLAITNVLAVTMRGDRLGILENATIAVDGGRIAYVGSSDDFSGGAERTIDGDGLVATPGLVNVHAHTDLTLLRGGAQDVPEIEWMNDALGPLSAAMKPEDRTAGARLGALEALRSGVTAVGEYARNVDVLVEEVYEPMGVRVVAAETINAVDGPTDDLGLDEPYPFDEEQGWVALERNESLFESCADRDRASALYGPQALDMVPRELLEAIRDRAEQRDRGIHMHVAQGQREQRQIESRYGADETTVSVLEELEFVSDRLLAAHLHGATVEERARLADAGVRMAANPSSIAAIDGITPPIVEYRNAGGVAGIGTDQAPGPGGHDFLRELRTTALLAKTKRTDPTSFPAWEALRVGTIEGARALGIDEQVGSLEEGKQADIVLLDLEHPSTAPTVTEPLHTAVPNLVYGANGGVVDTVLVEGEVVLEDGELRTVDEGGIIKEANERAVDVFDRAGDAWRHADSELVGAVEEGWL